MGKIERKPKGYWTKDLCKSVAIQYQTRYEWQSKHLASYKAAFKNSWLDECCAHMDVLIRPKGYWTLERCITSASGFETRKGWQTGDSAAYKAAFKAGWLDACCAHMREVLKPRGYWSLDACMAEASRFESRTDWARGHPASYGAAQKNGWLERCSAHMPEIYKPNNYWTKERCLEDASRFETRTEWKLRGVSSHTTAQRNGWLHEIADAVGMPNYSGSTAQREFAQRYRALVEGSDIELREEVYGLSGPRTKVDMAFYRNSIPFLVVEYQGAFWHSEAAGKTKDYHLKRRRALQEKGIRLITVHEDDADNPVIDSMIRSALGLVEEKIRASKCAVALVSDVTSSAFYEKSHIQGGRISGKDRVNIGLKHSGRLVACMTFVRSNDRHTGSGNYDWCLHRFATAPNVRVLGSASKLLKRFRDTHPTESVVSYCDLQFFSGETYQAIGFRHIRDNPPDYRWVKAQTVLAKHEAQRKFLPSLLGDAFDESLSERENMERAGYSKIWDCGKAVYALVP